MPGAEVRRIATQPRIIQRAPQARLNTTKRQPLASRAGLARLLMVAAATGIVVGVWSLDGEDAPPLVTAEPIVSITAPAPEPRAGAVPLPIDFGIGAARSLPADALPRPPEPAEPAMPDSFERFIVQRGDTIFDISVVFGVGISEILRFNPDLGDGASVSVGQAVMVPIYAE